ncbi:two-component system sensor histidine kinase RstB [Deefgea piscis]|uniref:histidine kinase n=1 Tax=Deefgea piscis TaxID=2739061 RepID=A0A6M8SN04_9NEIS|nr:ATP-binding protein [Deefgea piscis]QKJ66543.1 two-component system sensor histidine kinase RstB [Deefgea piscis]
MRQVFLRFYLTVVVCFLATSLLIGGIYKQLIERTNQRYLTDIFKSTVSIIEEELGDLPPSLWHDEASRLRGKLPVPVQIEKLGEYSLSAENQKSLEKGDIILLLDKGLYIHRIHKTDQMVVLGPIPFLTDLDNISWLDFLALLMMGAALGLPTWLWLRPFWRDLLQIIQQSRRVGQGDFAARVKLDESSALASLGVTFNSMAQDVEQLTTSRRAMIDAVSHDLRTPLARMRYRLEAIKSGADSGPQVAALERDLGQIDALIEEWLTMSSLDSPQMQMNIQPQAMLPWLGKIAAELSLSGKAPQIVNQIDAIDPYLEMDSYYFGRAVSNVLSNARRYGGDTIVMTLKWHEGMAQLLIDDNGEGIPEEQRSRLLQPFTRMEGSRNKATGGFGLGLAIVAMILRGHGGQVTIESSPAGGARIILAWPSPLRV